MGKLRLAIVAHEKGAAARAIDAAATNLSAQK
jgi:hypothetical protein